MVGVGAGLHRVVVAVLLVLGLLPGVAARSSAEAAAPAAVAATAGVPASAPGRPTAPGEVPELRTAYSRTSRTGDGTFETEVFPAPVHYLDGSSWLPIDNRLVDGGPSWVNAANRFRVELPTRWGTAPVTMRAGERWLTMALVGGASVAGSAEGAVAAYRGVMPGVDVVYEVGNDRVKEAIVLAGPAAPSSFTFDLRTTPGLAARPAAGGAVDLVDGGATVFRLEAPFMVDAAGAESAAVRLATRPVTGGFRVTVSADRSWLADPARAWPVTVDPTVTFGDDQGAVDETVDCHVSSATPAASACTSGNLKIGRIASTGGRFRTLARFPTLLDVVPADAKIAQARLELWLEGGTTSGSVTLEAHQVDRAWTESVTWNAYDGTTAWSAPGGQAGTDYSGPTASATVDPATAGWRSVDVRALVREWVDGDATNRGFLLKTGNDTTTDQVVTFTSSDAATSSRWPRLVVRYEANTGVRPFYSYERWDLTDRSGAAVNVANGNLVVTADDLEVQATGLALSLSRHYNGLWNHSWTTGEGWTITGGPNIRLTELDGGAVELTGPSNYHEVFEPNGSGGWVRPHGVDADLAKPGARYELTYRHSQERLTFESWPADPDVYVLTEQRDRNGNEVVHGYDSSGAWTVSQHVRNGVSIMATAVVTMVSGRTTKLAVTADGRTREWRYGYDASNNLATYTDPDDHQTVYVYDTAHRMTCVVTPENRVTRFVYGTGDDRRVASVVRVDMEGLEGTNHCDDGTGPTTSFDYDADLPEACEDDPDVDGQVATAVTDANGWTTTYCYDEHDRVQVVVDAEGQRREQDYTATGSVEDLTDGLGAVGDLTWSTDGNDNLLSVTAPEGGGVAASTTFSYQTSSTVSGYQFLPSSTNDTEGNCSSLDYDTDGNLTDVEAGRQPSGSSCTGTATSHIHQEYNPDGTVDFVDAPNGERTDFEYIGGNLTEVIPPSGSVLRTERFTYDGANRVRTYTDGNGQKTCIAYDGNDRVTRLDFQAGSTCPAATDPCPATTCIVYVYDGDGNLVARTDVTGTTSFDYDELGRLERQRFGTSSFACNHDVTTYGYDAVGNLTSTCDDGGTVRHWYNRVNLPVALAEPGGACDTTPITLCTTFGYDGRGRRTVTTYPTSPGVVMLTDYDDPGNITRIAGRVNLLPNSGFEADASGWVVVAGSATMARTATADRRGHGGLVSARLTASSSAGIRVATTQGTGGVAVQPGTSYRAGAWVRGPSDDDGGTTVRIKIDWYDGAGTLLSSSADGIGKDVERRWEQVTVEATSPAGAAFASVRVGFDSGTGEVHHLDDVHLSALDATGTLTDHAYTYTDAGNDRRNRQTATDHVADRTVAYDYDGMNRLVRAETTSGGTDLWTYDYDANGNRTKWTHGTTTNWARYGPGNVLCWTAVATTEPTAPCDSLPITPLVQYTHDPNGNIVSATNGTAFSYNAKNQTVAMATPSGNIASLSYADVDQTERTAAGGVSFRDSALGLATATSVGDTVHWTRDSGGTLVVQRVVDPTNTTRRYYLYDGSGSTAGIVTPAGALASGYRYRYDPYGNLLSGTPPRNPWRYGGGYYDSQTRLTKFGARYYDPAIGRWTQQDPISGTIADPNTLNRYVYVGGNPVNETDPTGYSWTQWFATGATALITASLAGATCAFTATLGCSIAVGTATGLTTFVYESTGGEAPSDAVVSGACAGVLAGVSHVFGTVLSDPVCDFVTG